MRNASKTNNSVVAMVLDQVKSGREVIGTVVTVVPDNKEYKVTAVDVAEGSVTVTEVLPEDSDAVADVVVLTEKNTRIAHYVNNPNEKPVPEASVKDVNGKSILVFDDGKEVSCGQIKVIKVLGGIKGSVLLLTESNDGDALVDVMAYDVQPDEFRQVYEAFSTKDAEIQLVRLAEDVVLLFDRLIAIKEEKDDNGVVTDRYGVLMYNNLYQVDGSGYLSQINDEYDDVDSDLPIVSNVGLAKQADRRDLILVSMAEVVDGKVKACEPKLTLYRVNRAGEVCEEVASYKVNSDKARVYLGGASGSAPVITVKDKDQVLITTSRGTLIVDEPEVVAALDGFNFFDGVYAYEDENGYQGAKWYYSNKAREEICFTSVETDRGTLFALA